MKEYTQFHQPKLELFQLQPSKNLIFYWLMIFFFVKFVLIYSLLNTVGLQNSFGNYAKL